MYDKLITKVNVIDTDGFVLKTQYNTDKSGLEMKIDNASKKIPDASELVKVADCNPKITEIECKISSITDLATTAALNTVENKIPTDTAFKYFNTNDYNKFTNKIIDNEIKEKKYLKYLKFLDSWINRQH